MRTRLTEPIAFLEGRTPQEVFDIMCARFLQYAWIEGHMGEYYKSTTDDFQGTTIGGYTTKEGKKGLVLQMHGTRVVHVYQLKWLVDDPAD